MNPQRAADIELAMRHAFRSGSSLSAGERLASLLPESESSPTVVLRDLPGATGPIHLRTSEAAGTLDPEGRYHVFGEVARGGVGVVLRARDQMLGREVAIKLLDERHCERSSIVRRFLEEAQIAGQLQHPGVVPVHDVGMARDGRPFLVLKLIQGRTLAALFGARQGPEDQERMLAAFLRVCETMAYVHARGVIHRDLKPGNIMVGAFGEVQVMDFGLAKVLMRAEPEEVHGDDAAAAVTTVRSGDPSTASATGSVMGTFAYMAPEQARGEVEDLDERADVFSLGAVLCEILTGVAPYGRGPSEQIKLRAADAELAEAVRRLAACRADPALVSLCQNCLAPQRDDRPRDAGVLATELDGLRLAVERRAKEAEAAATRADERARAERRARRLQLGLVAAVSSLIVLASVGWSWRRQVLATRAQHIASAVDDALLEAQRHRISGEAQASPDPAVWIEAVSAARRAVTLAADDGADAGVRARAAATFADIASAEERVKERAARATRNQEMARRLVEIRTAASIHWDWMRQDREYTTTFREYGIDVLSLDGSQAIAAVQKSAIADDLVAALGDWSRAARMAHGAEAGVRQRAVALGAEPDPLRRRIREAMEKGDGAGLLRIAQETDRQGLPLQTVRLLSGALTRTGGKDMALDMLRAACVDHPSDFWVHFLLAQALDDFRGGPVPEEAALHYGAAFALAPEGEAAATNLATVLWRRGDPVTAERLHRRVVALRSDSALAHFNLGIFLEREGRHAAACTAYAEALRLDGDNPSHHCRHACMLRRTNQLDAADRAFQVALARWPRDVDLLLARGALLCDEMARPGDAVECFRHVTEVEPGELAGHRNLAVALEKKGDLSAALDAWGRVLELQPGLAEAHRNVGNLLLRLQRFQLAADAFHALVTIEPENALAHWLLAIALDGVDDVAGAIRATQEACRLKPDMAEAWHNLGVFLNHTGRFEEALAAAQRSIALQPMAAASHAEASQALLGLGRVDDAILALEQACRLDPSDADAAEALAKARAMRK